MKAILVRALCGSSLSGMFLCLLACGQDSKSDAFTFDKDEPGKPPAGWIADSTGTHKAKAPRWEVRKEEGGNVLAQLETEGEGGDYPVCIRKETSFKDGTVSVRLKAVSGSIDQAGGVVFRAKDKDNFYVVRANAKENNVSIYYTQAGRRITMEYWQNVPVKLGDWHTLKVEAQDFTFKVWFNDKLVGETEDEKKVFPDAGMVGVWTISDSVTYFKDLAVAPVIGR